MAGESLAFIHRRGCAAAVGVDDPRRLAVAVEQVLVVEPLDLVVDRPRLGGLRLRPVARSSTLKRQTVGSCPTAFL